MELLFALLAGILSSMAFFFSVINFIELRAMQKSTHQIQMVPVDEFGKVQGQVQQMVNKDQMSEDLDNII